jgi:LDH2 family malate/lactate/ureidoglycolate dehydrogenase
VISAQKVRLAAQEGASVPEGTILDRAGRPTTDPGELLAGGTMAPLGSPDAPHKGFGLALFVDALAGVLSGAAFARGVAVAAPGSVLWALDVEAFLPRQEFLERMDAQIDQVKQGGRLPGLDELLVPGEGGQRRYLDRIARGTVPLAPASWRVLATSCESLGSPLPAVLEP